MVFLICVVDVIEEVDIIFICVNMFIKIYGIGVGFMVDVSVIESVMWIVVKYVKEGVIVVEKSIVLCGIV